MEIKAAAREPGHRTKIAVWSNDPNVDPVGACVGARGSRVRMVTNELRGERVDVVPYSDDPVELIQSALAPARVREVRLDDDSGTATVIVSDYQLSLAIGKRGQNARLSSRLTGWQVDIDPEVVVSVGFQEKVAHAVKEVAAIPGISQQQADVLVHHGLTRLEDLLQADASDLAGIPELGDQSTAIMAAVWAEAKRRGIKLGPGMDPGAV